MKKQKKDEINIGCWFLGLFLGAMFAIGFVWTLSHIGNGVMWVLDLGERIESLEERTHAHDYDFIQDIRYEW